ncbi:hypothetical protein QQP08_002372 [Theobroma cacao]|nr:hypothetical protein QQP08_002372 [Theobroma cacao]
MFSKRRVFNRKRCPSSSSKFQETAAVAHRWIVSITGLFPMYIVLVGRLCKRRFVIDKDIGKLPTNYFSIAPFEIQILKSGTFLPFRGSAIFSKAIHAIVSLIPLSTIKFKLLSVHGSFYGLMGLYRLNWFLDLVLTDFQQKGNRPKFLIHLVSIFSISLSLRFPKLRWCGTTLYEVC